MAAIFIYLVAILLNSVIYHRSLTIWIRSLGFKLVWLQSKIQLLKINNIIVSYIFWCKLRQDSSSRKQEHGTGDRLHADIKDLQTQEAKLDQEIGSLQEKCVIIGVFMLVLNLEGD